MWTRLLAFGSLGSDLPKLCASYTNTLMPASARRLYSAASLELIDKRKIDTHRASSRTQEANYFQRRSDVEPCLCHTRRSASRSRGGRLERPSRYHHEPASADNTAFAPCSGKWHGIADGFTPRTATLPAAEAFRRDTQHKFHEMASGCGRHKNIEQLLFKTSIYDLRLDKALPAIHKGARDESSHAILRSCDFCSTSDGSQISQEGSFGRDETVGNFGFRI